MQHIFGLFNSISIYEFYWLRRMFDQSQARSGETDQSAARVLTNHSIVQRPSHAMMFLPRPPSSWPGLNPPEGRGGFCASNLFSMLTLMSLAKVKNASSTFILALAEVSMNFIPYSIASCSPRSLETYNKKRVEED